MDSFYVAADSSELFLLRTNQTCSARYTKASPFVAATAAMDVHGAKDPYVYVLLYMLYSCQDILTLAQKPVALQRRLGLLGQCLRDVALRHQRT